MLTFKRFGRVIKFSSDSLLDKKRVKDALTFAVEGTEYSKSYRNSKWDGLCRFYDRRQSTFDCGMLSVVLKAISKRGVEHRIVADFEQIPLAGRTINTTLWDHQNQAVKVFLQRPFGRVQFPTRTGKTIFAAECIRLIGGVSLFVVDTQDLFLQAVDDISKFLKTNKIGKIGAGQFNVVDGVNVATVQTLQNIYYGTKKGSREQRKILLTFFNKLDFLIVDECHEHGSVDRVDMFKSITNCQAYLGLSATPEKSENQLKNLRLQSCFGDIIFKADQKDLKQKGILAQENVLLINVDHDANKNISITKKDAYDNYEDKIIIYNQHRNQLIVNIIEFCRKLNLKTLVLFQYRDHALQVQKITGDEFITGSDKLQVRTDARKSFLRKKGGVLLVTNIFKKGITLPEAEVFINAGGGLEQSEVVQKKGRVLGVKGKKTKALIIDFIDIYKYFDRHSLKRIEVYEQHAGLENIVVFDANDDDFYIDVKEYISTWGET